MKPIETCLARNGEMESRHIVHAVAMDVGTGEQWTRGDGGLIAFWRSAMKPFQALPVVSDGVLTRAGLGSEGLALACASHHGTVEQIDIVRRMMEKTGSSEGDLACGAHRPVDEAAARALDRSGRLPGRIHNNCSGKHAAMLALARERGWGVEGYHRYEHPLQKAIRDELRRWIDRDPEALSWGIDGCGVPTPALELREMAAAYGRLAVSTEAAPRAVVTAMTKHASLISGPGGLTSGLMSATRGRLLAKEGAEGVFCVAEPGTSWGAAFKVRDGAMRALGPSVVGALRDWNRLRDDELSRLAAFSEVPVTNTRGDIVASIRACEADDSD